MERVKQRRAIFGVQRCIQAEGVALVPLKSAIWLEADRVFIAAQHTARGGLPGERRFCVRAIHPAIEPEGDRVPQAQLTGGRGLNINHFQVGDLIDLRSNMNRASQHQQIE